MFSRRTIYSLLLLAFAASCRAASDSAAMAELQRAIHAGNVDSVRSLLAGDRTLLNARSAGSGQTPLMAATLQGQTEVVKYLLTVDGVDWTIGEKDGYTPMHGAGFQVGTVDSWTAASICLWLCVPLPFILL